MLHIVTVPGGNGVVIAIPFTSADTAAVASLLLQGLQETPLPALHIHHASDGSSGLAAVANDMNLFLADQAGTAAVPNGYQYLVDDYHLTYTYGGIQQQYQAPATSFIAFGTLDGALIDSETNALTYYGGTGRVSIVGGNPITAADPITINAPGTGSGGGVIVLEGNGVENLNLNSGNWSVTTGTGPVSITLGSGINTVSGNGSTTIHGGSGAMSDRLSGVQNVVFGGAGKAQFFDHGISDSITGGSGNATVSAQGSNLHVSGGGGEVLFIDLTGGNTVTAGNSGVVAFGVNGSGSTYNSGHSYFIFSSGGGDDTINAAAGTLGPLVFGSNGADLHLDAAAPGAFVVAGAGSETIDASGSSQGVIFFGGIGSTEVLGSPTAANFYAASTGPTTMTGGVGNVYEFIDHHVGSNNLITDFAGSDALYLSNYGLGAQDGIVSEQVSNGDLTMKLNDGTTIIFQNVTSASQLNGHIFHI